MSCQQKGTSDMVVGVSPPNQQEKVDEPSREFACVTELGRVVHKPEACAAFKGDLIRLEK